MKIYLIRHGQTDWNRQRKIQGRTDVPLNEYGRYAAKLTAEGLKDVCFDVAFTSPLSRAKETAQIILNNRQVPIVEDKRIIEVDFGGYEGKHFDIKDKNLQNFFEKPELYESINGSEPMTAILRRTGEFLDWLCDNPKYQDSTILVSTHGAALAALLCNILGGNSADYWKGKLHKNCGISIVEASEGRVKLIKNSIIVYDEETLLEYGRNLQK